MEIKKEETWNYLQSTTENSIRFSVSVWLPVSEITTVPVRHAAWGKLGLQDSVMEHNRHNTSITVGTGSKSKLQWCIHSKRHLLLRPLSCLAESWHETSAFYNRSKRTSTKEHRHLGLIGTPSFLQKLQLPMAFFGPNQFYQYTGGQQLGWDFPRACFCLQI